MIKQKTPILLGIVILCILVLAAVATVARRATNSRVAPTATSAPTRPATSGHGQGFSYAPPEIETSGAGSYLFGLPNGHGVVLSPYGYEANLLDYSTPVADIDYLLSYGVHATVSLPGFATDRYVYEGAAWVDGSGWVSKWATPNGGRFAFLHIAAMYTPTYGMPHFAAPNTLTTIPNKPGVTFNGDNLTAQVIGYASTTSSLPQATYYPGGAAIGTSGWPTWSIYGNGAAGPVDAHLCFLVDARAASWFTAIVNGTHHRPRPPKPAPHFSLTKWRHWCTRHHKHSCVSPYHTISRHRQAFTTAAAAWIPHQGLAGVKTKTTYKGSHHRRTFVITDFECGGIVTWPKTHLAPKIVRHRCKG